MIDHAISHLQTIFSHVSPLPFCIIYSANEELSHLDKGLRKQFKNCTQMYDDLYNLLSKEVSCGIILHVQDIFGLNYVVFQPGLESKPLCVLGPFIEKCSETSSHNTYMQQALGLAEISVNSVCETARSIIILLSETPSDSIKELHNLEAQVLSVQLSIDFRQNVSPIIKQLIYYIQTHLHQKLTLQSLSDYFGLSKTYISHHFREEIGLAPMQYIIQQRMFRAQHLISTAVIPIKEIADTVGIPDCSYFTKVFREHTGLTPSEYRKQHK